MEVLATAHRQMGAETILEEESRFVAGKSTDCINTSLTARESEIAKMLSCGFDESTVAYMFGMRPATVHNHIRAIYNKLGVTSRARMVATLLCCGVIKIETMHGLLNQTGYCEFE